MLIRKLLIRGDEGLSKGWGEKLGVEGSVSRKRAGHEKTLKRHSIKTTKQERKAGVSVERKKFPDRQESELREETVRRLESALQALAFSLERREGQEAAQRSELESVFRAVAERLDTLETKIRAVLAETTFPEVPLPEMSFVETEVETDEDDSGERGQEIIETNVDEMSVASAGTQIFSETRALSDAWPNEAGPKTAEREG